MDKEQPAFRLFLINEGMTSAIELFRFNSGYGLRNVGMGGLELTTLIYDILELTQQLDVQYQKRKKATNPNYLDIPTKIKLDALHTKIVELRRMQEKETDDGF